MRAGESAVHTIDHDVDLWCFPSQGTYEPEGTFSCSEPIGYLTVTSDSGYEALLITPNGYVGTVTPGT